MSILIAGEQVNLGDTLYVRIAGLNGVVIGKTDTTVTVRVTKATSHRDYVVTQGGRINGDRAVYWHPPLQLDLPKSRVGMWTKLQELVNKVLEVF